VSDFEFPADHPDRVRVAAEVLRGEARTATEGRRILDRRIVSVAAAWQEYSADRARQRLSLVAGWMTDAANACDAAASALDSYAEVLTRARHRIELLRLEHLVSVGLADGALQEQYVEIRASVSESAADTAAALKSASRKGDSNSPRQRLATALPGLGPLAPPPGSDPRHVARWWQSLSAEDQQTLIFDRYRQLQNLNGLPAGVLDQANRRCLADDLATLTGQELNNAQGIHRAADAVPSPVDGFGPVPPVLLLHYAPSEPLGHGSAAIAYGNPDTAANTAVVIPGTSASTTSMSVCNDAKALYGAIPAGSHSVLTWLGYPAPPTLLDAASRSWAEAGTAPLVEDVAGLRAAHEAATGEHGHLTAIGHSYGSYELGRAISHGADVDDAVFIGSPGAGVDHAADLGMAPSHVWDGRTADDPIAVANNWFTPEPVFGNGVEDPEFGARHFDVSGSHGHSEYYQGESLRNLAAIAAGDAASVHEVPAPDLRGSLFAGVNELAREELPWVRSAEDTVADGWHTVKGWLP